MDLQAIFKDPEFRGMQSQDKVKVLTAADPEFGKLTPEDKMKVLISGLYPHIYDAAPEAHDNGFWNTIGNDLMHVPESLYKLVTGDPKTYQGLIQAQVNEAKQASLGSVEGLGHGLAAILPLVGPMAAQAGTEIGEGATGQGFAHATELLAPSLGPKVVKGAMTVVPKAVEGYIGRGGMMGIARSLLRGEAPNSTPNEYTSVPRYS